MSRPSITLNVRTATEAGLLYARVAPAVPNAVLQAHVAFVIDVTNDGPETVTLDRLVVDFPTAPAIDPHEVEMAVVVGDPPAPQDVVIPPGEARRWWHEPDGNLVIIGPPAQARLSVYCRGYDEPERLTLPLVAHASGPGGKGYGFPASRSDLADDEYWHGGSATHLPAGGVQLFAYDLVVIGWNPQWRQRYPDTDGKRNEDFRVFGKPVYAMADGYVVASLDGMPDNVPGEFREDPGEGNHVYLKHGDEYALYAHLRNGSVPARLLEPGAAVARGELLGEVGNSGRSGGPHLHLQVTRDLPHTGIGLPLHFATFRAQDVDELDTAPDTEGWVKVSNCALPPVWSAIRPPHIVRETPDYSFVPKPGKPTERLVAKPSLGVTKGGAGTATLRGGRRKPIGPR